MEGASFGAAQTSGSGLNFTPYQAAQYGVTKTSQGLKESNPMLVGSAAGTTPNAQNPAT